MATNIAVVSHTPDDEDVSEMFMDYAFDFLTEAQMESIRLHLIREDLDWPVYILLGSGREPVMTTSNRSEATLHMTENEAVVSFISSNSLIDAYVAE